MPTSSGSLYEQFTTKASTKSYDHIGDTQGNFLDTWSAHPYGIVKIMTGSPAIDTWIRNVKIDLRKIGSPSGNAYIRVWDDNDSVLTETSFAPNTLLTTSQATYEFALPIPIKLKLNYKVGVFYNVSTGSAHRIDTWITTSDTVESGYTIGFTILNDDALNKNLLITFDSTPIDPLPQGQRFVENFSGDALDTDRWATADYNTAPAYYRMGDSVNGGFEIVTAATNNTGGSITFGNVARQYSETGSVFICVAKGDDSTTETFVGFVKDHTIWGVYRNMATISNIPNEGVLFSHTSNASADTQTSSGSSFNSTSAVYKVECKASSIEFGSNGSIGSTVTTTLPVVPMQPRFGVRALSAATHTGRCSYLECYNT